MKTLTSYGNLKAKSLAHTHLYNAQTRPVTDVSEVGVVFSDVLHHQFCDSF